MFDSEALVLQECLRELGPFGLTMARPTDRSACTVYPLTACAKPATRRQPITEQHAASLAAGTRRKTARRTRSWRLPETVPVMRFEIGRETGRNPASTMAPPNETGNFPQTLARPPVAAVVPSRTTNDGAPPEKIVGVRSPTIPQRLPATISASIPKVRAGCPGRLPRPLGPREVPVRVRVAKQ